MIFTASKIWDAITDPLMGAISDRTKSRFGRRRPYFLMGIPLIFLSFAMMWYPLSSGSEISKVIFYGFAYMLSNTEMCIRDRNWFAWRKAGVLCSEMEAAVLFITAHMLGVKAGGIMVAGPSIQSLQNLLKTAVLAIEILIGKDRGGM